MPVRQIVLDTETTGLSPQEGNRLVQIACVELIDGVATGKHYNVYINPERESNPLALKVHGLTTEFLADKPKFGEVVDEFMQFIGEDALIIHNAPFDLGFLNHELQLLGKPALKNPAVDTRVIAQQLYSKEFLTTELISKGLVNDEQIVLELKAQSDNEQSLIAKLVESSKFRVHSLDHLCLYYGISLATREKHHGALIDCGLLTQVYAQLKQEQLKQEVAKGSVTALGLFQQPKKQDSDVSTIGLQVQL
jgi:DNA polymerase III epsilon subunit-like protein